MLCFFLGFQIKKFIYLLQKHYYNIYTLLGYLFHELLGGCGTRKFLNSRELYVSIRVTKYISILDLSLTYKINTKRYICV